MAWAGDEYSLIFFVNGETKLSKPLNTRLFITAGTL